MPMKSDEENVKNQAMLKKKPKYNITFNLQLRQC